MPTMRMRKRDIEELKAPDPSGRQVIYWATDPDYRGLGVLVSGKTATKTWVAQAKLRDSGLARRVTIGPVHVLGLADAWREASEQLAKIITGTDPRAEARQARERTVTVRAAFEAYLADSQNLRPYSVAQYRGHFENYLKPWLDRQLRSIDSDVVSERFKAIKREVLDRVRSGKTNGGVNVTGETIAQLVMGRFAAVWGWQRQKDSTLPPSPTWVLKRSQRKATRRTRMIPVSRLPEFWAAAQALSNPILRDLVTLGLFTGMRDRNCCGLRWDEVDLSAKALVIPADRMKADAEFKLPLSDVVYEMLVARRSLGRGEYVFPGTGKRGHTRAFSAALQRIAEKTTVRVSPHDVRRTFATVAESVEGLSVYQLKRLLAHGAGAGGDVTAGYIQMQEDRLAAAVQAVANKLKELCEIESLPESVPSLASRR